MISTLINCMLLFALAESANAGRADSTVRMPVHVEDRRIWHEVLHPQPCQVIVDIFATDGKKVRRFLDRTLGGGIYNWHWDALDDSGRFVAEGNYRAVINDCKKAFYENLTIRYQPGEKDFRLLDTVISIEGGIPIQVRSDSLRISGKLLSPFADDFSFFDIRDTLLHRGVHHLPIHSDQIHPGSRVLLLIRTHQLERQFDIELRK